MAKKKASEQAEDIIVQSTDESPELQPEPSPPAAEPAETEEQPVDAPFQIVVGRVISRKNKKLGIDEGESLISVGPLPIIYSKLVVPTHPSTKDKYTVMFQLTKEQRNWIISKLAETGVKVAAVRGLTLTQKEVESTLRAKMGELEEPDTYKLAADQRVAFERTDQETGEPYLSIVQLTVKGPNGETLEKPYLTNGSMGYANFVMACTINSETKKPQFPFRLKAVKVTKPVFYERKEGDRIAYDDFSQVESSY